MLVDLVTELSASGVEGIIVVNDGSGPDYQETFSAVSRLPKVVVLEHAVNLGKGAALKTGINHAACHHPDSVGVVTADADGQHLAADVLHVARTVVDNPQSLVLGSRRFDRQTPWRSRAGNYATRHLFRLLTGCALRDTQTGLRGIPREMMLRLLRLPSQGYEFELEMLILARQTKRRILETDIRTVYADGNKPSHFNPLPDSMRIYFTLFRFLIVALLTAGIDYTVFVAAYLLGAPIYGAQILARFVAMFFNYPAVRNAVFNSGQSHAEVILKYLLLVVISGSISYCVILVLVSEFSLGVIVAKMIAESLIFLANFAIQRDFVFIRQAGKKGNPG